MSVYDDVLTAVLNTMQQSGTNDNIYIGSLPPDNALSVTWASGEYSPFLSKTSAAVTLSLVFNGKNVDQQTLSDSMGSIHQHLSTLKTYPTTDTFQITNIQTMSPPTLIGREENKQWLYGSSLEVKFFLKGE